MIDKCCNLGTTNLSFFVWLITLKYNVNLHSNINYIEANITVWIGLRKYRSYPEIGFSSLMFSSWFLSMQITIEVKCHLVYLCWLFLDISVKQGLLFLFFIMVTYSITWVNNLCSYIYEINQFEHHINHWPSCIFWIRMSWINSNKWTKVEQAFSSCQLYVATSYTFLQLTNLSTDHKCIYSFHDCRRE